MKNISPKEAIKVLKDMKIETTLPKAAVTQRKRNAAIEMAIDVLRCSENPNSSDVISRQAAIDAIDECYCGGEDSCGEPWIYKENAVEAINMIEPILSVEPKRETTTLRIGRTRNSVTMWYECAECGEPVDQEDAFCRRCGRGIIHE